METLFPLHIFPEGALTHSVITTVWIGVLVVAFFNLRLGWPLTGIVIPGYLVPLAISKPWAALTVLVEGIITYWLVRFFSNYLSRLGKWNNLFGRDRFFALVLTSLVVRIVLDGWVLPGLGQWLNSQMGVAFDFSSNMRSFGLIITALIANYFWKPGLRRGMISLMTVSGITFLIIRFGLMEYTNFNIGRIEYMFEDLVTFFLASPKAYIIIIVTSFMASRMNVKYGWEYSGIMIPSLLALQWYQPVKLAATLVEAAVILGIGTLIMRLPVFRGATIEGARKLLLFFNISFLYKFTLGHVLLLTAPQVHISDYYGFGYLLSTLIAIKMHQKSFLPQMTRSLFQTSLVAVVVASLLGFGMTLVSQVFMPSPPIRISSALQPGSLTGGLVETLRREKLHLYKNRDPETIQLPTPPELDDFAEAMRYILVYTSKGDTGSLEKAGYFLSRSDYRLDIVDSQYLLVHENPPYRGGGLYVFKLEQPDTGGIVLEIPAPIDEWLILEAGAWLFPQLEARAMAVAGTSRQASWDNSTDVLYNPQSFFQVFHRVVARNNALQLRAHTPETRRLLEGIRPSENKSEQRKATSSLWVKSSFPPDLPLAKLKKLVGEYNIHWDAPHLQNVQRSHSRKGFAELFLNRAASRKAMISVMLGKRDVSPQDHIQRIDGYLQQWLLTGKGEIAVKGSDLYRPIQLQELLFLDQEILTPLFKTVNQEYKPGQLAFTDEGRAELQAIDAAASLLGYRLSWYRHMPDRRDYLILSEEPRNLQRRFWGTYVFRLGPSSPHVVEIPRPLFERNSFEYGVNLFERLNASALLIAGAHPYANRDRQSDVVHFRNKDNLFNLVNQVILRESGDMPLMMVACRAFGYRPDLPQLTGDAFLAMGDWTHDPQKYSPRGKALWDSLTSDGLKVQPVDGSETTRGYELGMMAQYLYLPSTVNKEFALLWLSPELRAHYRQQTENRLEESRFASLGIPSESIDLYRYANRNRGTPSPTPLPEALKQQVNRYIDQQDIVLLHQLAARWKHHRFSRVVDINSRNAFLSIKTKDGSLIALANLVPRQKRTITATFGESGSQTQALQSLLREYIDSHSAWMIFNQSSGGHRP
jgi:gamma-polyglutamate biosynthesis protein CapC